MPMSLGLGLALGCGGADRFAPSKAALKAYLATTAGADNPHSLPAMASPPTITTDTSAGPATTYPKWLAWATPAHLAQALLEGGDATIAAGTMLSPKVCTLSSGVRGGVASRLSVSVVSADAICFYVGGSTLPYRFLINGQYVDKTGTIPGATTGTGNNYIILTPASPLTGVITIEMQGSQSCRRIMIKNAASYGAKPAAKGWRDLTVGDSVTAATGATIGGDGYVTVFSDYSGMDSWPSGVGGSGWSATNGGTRYKLADRVGADIDAMLATGPINSVTVAMGLNDLTAQANVLADGNAALDIIRAKLPDALIFVIGCWDTQAPGAPGTNYNTLKPIIQQIVGGRPGVTFLDPQGTAYTNIGDVHPDTPGHATLGIWRDSALRAAVA